MLSAAKDLAEVVTASAFAASSFAALRMTVLAHRLEQPSS